MEGFLGSAAAQRLSSLASHPMLACLMYRVQRLKYEDVSFSLTGETVWRVTMLLKLLSFAY